MFRNTGHCNSPHFYDFGLYHLWLEQYLMDSRATCTHEIRRTIHVKSWNNRFAFKSFYFHAVKIFACVFFHSLSCVDIHIIYMLEFGRIFSFKKKLS